MGTTLGPPLNHESPFTLLSPVIWSSMLNLMLVKPLLTCWTESQKYLWLKIIGYIW